MAILFHPTVEGKNVHIPPYHGRYKLSRGVGTRSLTGSPSHGDVVAFLSSILQCSTGDFGLWYVSKFFNSLGCNISAVYYYTVSYNRKNWFADEEKYFTSLEECGSVMINRISKTSNWSVRSSDQEKNIDNFTLKTSRDEVFRTWKSVTGLVQYDWQLSERTPTFLFWWLYFWSPRDVSVFFRIR